MQDEGQAKSLKNQWKGWKKNGKEDITQSFLSDLKVWMRSEEKEVLSRDFLEIKLTAIDEKCMVINECKS